MAFESSQGITFTYASQVYTATQVSVSKSRQDIDISSTDLDEGDLRRIRVGPLDNIEIKVDWIGGSVPPVKQARDFSLTGNLGVSGGKAICTGLSISGNAGDLLRGSATFKVSHD